VSETPDDDPRASAMDVLPEDSNDLSEREEQMAQELQLALLGAIDGGVDVISAQKALVSMFDYAEAIRKTAIREECDVQDLIDSEEVQSDREEVVGGE